MKFRTNIGTFPNRSGIQQIPAGSESIPQSYLNSVPRAIDGVRINPGQSTAYIQTGGGTVLEELNRGFGEASLHPFQVVVESIADDGGTFYATIKEGRVFGRVDNSIAFYATEGLATVNSLGVPSIAGINTDYTEEEEDGDTETVNDPDTLDSTSPTKGTSNANNNGTVGSTSTTSKVTGTTGPYAYKNGDPTKSGNAGSITGNTGSSYYKNSLAGNAASITKPNQGNSGIYHTVQKSGNAGTIITGSTRSTNGTYHTPSKSGNAGSIFSPTYTPPPAPTPPTP